MHICTAGLCVWSRRFVYIYVLFVYIYIIIMLTKTGCLVPYCSKISCKCKLCCLLFEFKSLQCGLLCPVSCTDRTIHAFRGSQALKYFLLNLNGTPHLQRVFQFFCYDSYAAIMYACRLRLDRRMQCRTSANCSAVYRCMCSTLKVHACSVHTGYVFFGSLVCFVS